jgi:hypothetical protein
MKKKMEAMAGEKIIIIITIIITETATEIIEGKRVFLPSFLLFINSVLYAPLGSEILSSLPL